MPASTPPPRRNLTSRSNSCGSRSPATHKAPSQNDRALLFWIAGFGREENDLLRNWHDYDHERCVPSYVRQETRIRTQCNGTRTRTRMERDDGTYFQSRTTRRVSYFEIACGSALECASIHDVQRDCDAIYDEADCRGKSDLKRIVSLLTRLIQRTETVSEGLIEYEYRDTEYE